jgi:hypothetical protein
MPLDDLLKEENAPAEISVQVGDQPVKFSVAELRELAAERNQTKALLAQREQELRDTGGRLASLEQSTAQLLRGAATAVEKDQQRPQADPVAGIKDYLRGLLSNEQGYDYTKDKYIGPAMELMAKRADDIATDKAKQIIDSGLKPMAEQLRTALQVAVGNAERSQFDSFPDKPKDVTLEQVRQYAQQHGIVDRQRGWPDIPRALAEMTAPTRQQTREESIKQEAYQRAISDMRKQSGVDMPFIATPRGVELREVKPPVSQTKTNGMFKTPEEMFDEALELAVNDTAILSPLTR